MTSTRFTSPSFAAELSRPSHARGILSLLFLLSVALLSGAQTAHYGGVQTTLRTGAGFPGVAVDASGNVFLADTSGNQILKLTPSNGTYTANSVVFGIDSPNGVAVDQAGNLYVTQTIQGTLRKFNPTNGIYTPSTVVTSLGSPNAVAVDATGNIFVVDQFGNKIYKFIFSSGSYIQTVAIPDNAGLSTPEGIALDAADNLYIADSGKNRIAKATNSGGTYTISTLISGIAPTAIALDPNGNLAIGVNNGLIYEALGGGTYTATTLATNFSFPQGVAFDAVGAIYVADGGTTRLVKQTRSILDFGAVAVGTNSPTQTIAFVFDTAGSLNASASIQALTMGAGGLDFLATSTGTCKPGVSYAAGATCTVDVSMTPKFAGTRNGAIVLNGSAGALAATGYVTGTGLGPQVAFPPVQTAAISGGFIGPRLIAVDGAGNIYIPDTGNNRVVKETLSGGTYTATTIGTDLNRPGAVAVDGAGNVYVADTFNNRILKETLSGGNYLQSVIPFYMSQGAGLAIDVKGNFYFTDQLARSLYKASPVGASYTVTLVDSGFSAALWGVAVDTNGNLYVADANANAVYKETPNGDAYTRSTLPLTLNHPVGVATDSLGNLYISNANDNTITKATVANGTFTGAVVVSGLNVPYGVAIDASGNVYVSDTGTNRILVENVTTPPALTFGSAAIGTTSTPQSVALTNLGNQPLVFSVPSAGQNPDTHTPFVLQASPATTCPVVNAGGATVSLAANTSCTLSYVLTPTIPSGSFSAFSIFTDNNLNVPGSQQKIPLSGSAVLGTQNITFTLPSPLVYFSGETVTLNATVDTGNPITYTFTGPATRSGPTLTFTGPGTVQVTAKVNGSSSYAAATVIATIIVTAAPPASVAIPTTSLGSSSAVQAVTLAFSTATTLNAIAATAIQVLTQGSPNLDFNYAPGGTCVAGGSYVGNQTCTVNVVFAPRFPGIRYGGVVLMNATGTTVASTYLQATGTGPLLAFAPATTTTITLPDTNSEIPQGTAVDSNGNIFVADQSSLYKETLVNGTYTQTALPIPPGYVSLSVAVDGKGNVYSPDFYRSRIIKETPSGSTYLQSLISLPDSSELWGIAVDGSGNLYVAGGTDGWVLKVTYSGGTYTTSVLASGFSHPLGVAVDADGNVFIGESQNGGIVYKETLSGGTYSQSTVADSLGDVSDVVLDGIGNFYAATTGFTVKGVRSGNSYSVGTVSSEFGQPRFIAIDSAGNLYGTDYTNSILRLNVASPAGRAFPNTAAGLTSTPLLMSVNNAGNAPLIISAPSSGLNPSTASNFTLEANANTTCPRIAVGGTPGTLAANTSCLLSYHFTPVVSGDITGTSVLTDNNLNIAASTQTIPLSGHADQGTQAISFQPASPIAYFAGETLNLNGATSSGLPITYVLNSGPATLLGSTLTLAGPGVIQITATQPGTADFAAAAPVAGSITVIAAPAGSFAYPATSVGSSAASQPVTVRFLSAVTLNSTLGTAIQALTQGAPNLDFTYAPGGTCTPGNAYAVNQTCTVNVVFSPRGPGTRYGAVVLNDASGNAVVSTYLHGTGIGPLLAFTPTPKSVATGFANPMGIAVDGNGNAYISDFPPPFGSLPSHVYKQTLSGGVYTQTSIDSGKIDPEGLAVDGAGNVYIAFYSLGLVVKETLSNGAYIESTLFSDPTSFPKSIAVDGEGNLFIAEAGTKRILKQTLSNGVYTQSTITTLTDVMYGIAVDALDNIYLTQPTVGKVLKETLANGVYTESTLATGLAYTEGVAVDGVGNVYIANLSQVLKLTPSNGNYIQSTVIDDANSINARGVAVGGDGNLYIINRPNGVSQLLQLAITTPPVLTFPDTPAGSVSAAQLITVSNVGNAALTFRVPPTDSNPSSVAPFSFQNSSSTCPILTPGSTPAFLPALTSCTFGFTFVPDVPGSVARTSILKDDNLNVSTAKQFISLLGTGTTQAAQTITFPPFASPLAYIYGETVTLPATASSGLPVVYTITGPATLVASTLTITGPGTIQITATQPGNAYFFAAAPVVQTITVVTAATAVSIPNTSVGSSSSTQTITLQFATATTLNTSLTSAIHVLTQGSPNLDFTYATGGTCAPGVSYVPNQACTVNVVFSPKSGGSRYGAVTLIDTDGNVAATVFLQGTGLGPQIAFGPSSQTIIPGTYGLFVRAVADGMGNVYVTDFVGGAVYKETLSGGVYTESTVSTSVGYPLGLAVDGAGNIYVGDGVFNRVFKEEPTATGYRETIIASGNNIAPFSVAVDGSGNVYILDANAELVRKETPSNGAYVESTFGSGFSSPIGIAVDAKGNVYIADSNTAHIVKETPTGGAYTQSSIGSTTGNPTAVSVGSSGIVYVIDSFNDSILKETPFGDSYVQSIVSTDPSHVSNFGSISVDGNGNLYLTDDIQEHILRENLSTPASLTFASTSTGATSASQAIIVSNNGNQPLIFSVPTTGSNPYTATNFILDTTSTTCPIIAAGGTTAALAPLTTCTFSYAFAPTAVGPLTGSSVLTDNNLNTAASTQAISLSGTAAQGTRTAQAITFTPPLQLRYPGTATLSATASSGLAVSYTLVSGPATLIGNTLTYTGIGTVIVRATQAGNVAYAAALPVQITLNVSLAQATIFWQPATLKIYTGTAIGATVLNASSSIPSTIAYSAYLLPSGTPFAVDTSTVLLAGSYGLTATITPTDNINYAITAISLLYTVQNMNVFVANQVGNMASFYNNGNVQTAAMTGGGIGAAVDPAGNVWSINARGAGISKFTNTGIFAASYAGPGTSTGTALAVDGQGKVWMANADGTITAFTNAGVPDSATPYASAANLNAPASLNIDTAGSLWIANAGNNTVTEIIGVAAPTTPTVTAVANGTPAAQP